MPKKRNSFKKKQEVEIKTKNKHFIKAINTLDDIEKDSEDEFYSQREQILLEDQVSESDSDQEVLALDIDDDDDDDELEEEALLRTVTRHLRKSGDDSQEESEQSQDEGWGKSRKSYYNADEDSQDDELGLFLLIQQRKKNWKQSVFKSLRYLQ